MNDQLTFFDLAPSATSSDPPAKVKASRLVRRDDPSTSRDAAERLIDSGALAGDSADALQLVRENPGRTAYELEAIDKMPSGKGHGRPDRIRKRLAGLEQSGLIRKGERRECFERKSNCFTWYPVGPDRGGKLWE